MPRITTTFSDLLSDLDNAITNAQVDHEIEEGEQGTIENKDAIRNLETISKKLAAWVGGVDLNEASSTFTIY